MQSTSINVKKPNRKKHCYRQRLNAPPETVFPLLCPVEELKWAPGWAPQAVFSMSGVVERECMFITPPEMPSERIGSIWIVTHHDPKNRNLVMYKVAPGHTVSKLEISLENESGNTTGANVSYEITAMGDSGDRFLEEFTEDWYKHFMLQWETDLNHYLDTGEKIEPE